MMVGGELVEAETLSSRPSLSCCSFFFPHQALESRDPAARLPPLQQFHGESDDLVCYSWGQHTHGQLLSLGVPGDFVSIPRLGHSINVTMAQAATAWIAKMLPEDHAS